jgi:hypothetical protein
MAKTEKIFRRRAYAATVVERDGIDFRRIVAIKQHDGNAKMSDLPGQLSIFFAAGRHNDRVDATLHEDAQQIDLTFPALVGDAEKQGVSVAAQHIFRGVDDATKTRN